MWVIDASASVVTDRGHLAITSAKDIFATETLRTQSMRR
jgi:hypothetical protein